MKMEWRTVSPEAIFPITPVIILITMTVFGSMGYTGVGILLSFLIAGTLFFFAAEEVLQIPLPEARNEQKSDIQKKIDQQIAEIDFTKTCSGCGAEFEKSSPRQIEYANSYYCEDCSKVGAYVMENVEKMIE